MSNLFSNRGIVILIAALSVLSALLVIGILAVTDQLFKARLERASVVPMIVSDSHSSH